MAHPLASTWTSHFFDDKKGTFGPDIFGNFDLRQMADTGDIGAGCTHGAAAVTGKATAANFSPVTHSIVIDHDGKHYRGTALLNPATGEIDKIVGTARFPIAVKLRKKAATAPQDEATWVATKP